MYELLTTAHEFLEYFLNVMSGQVLIGKYTIKWAMPIITILILSVRDCLYTSEFDVPALKGLILQIKVIFSHLKFCITLAKHN